MGSLWGRRWPACATGEARVLLPGRAPYAVAIEPRQHGSFGSDGVAQQAYRHIAIIFKGMVGGNGDAVRIKHGDFFRS